MQQKPRGPAVMYDIKSIRRMVPGRWYLGFACRSCGRPFAVLNDGGRASGGSTLVARAPAINVGCPHCGTITGYPPRDMTRFQATLT